MDHEHSHDHAYLHEHNIPHLHHESDVHDEAHNHAHSHDAANGHGHVHENTQAVLNRLSRAIGHLESVRKMVADGRDCSEVLIQIAAVRAAITNIGKVILQDHIQHLHQRRACWNSSAPFSVSGQNTVPVHPEHLLRCSQRNGTAYR